MSSIGDRVKERRIAMSLSQLELSRITGITQATLSRLEQGVHTNSIHLPTIAVALQCSTEYLAFGDSSEVNTQYKRLMYAANVFKGWATASALAEKLTMNGYSVIPQGLSNWKKRGLSYEAILKCSRIIGCNTLWLETGEGEPQVGGANPSMPSAVDLIAESLTDEQLKAWLEIGRLMNANRRNS